MKNQTKYIEWSNNLDTEEIESIFKKHRCKKVLVKELAASQDNSKNQIYFAGDIAELAALPKGEPTEGLTRSSKTTSGKTIRLTFPLPFSWITPDGLEPAISAKLIYYPQYPEVRFSGYLSGVKNGPSEVVGDRRFSTAGRILLIGVTPEEKIVGIALSRDASSHWDVLQRCSTDRIATFKSWNLYQLDNQTSKERLIRTLEEVVSLGWIEGKKFNKNGEIEYYGGSNGAGVTLETALGIKANSYSVPDFEDYELKAIAGRAPSKAITLLTPEPRSGLYQKDFQKFMFDFAYPDQHDAARLNFGGTHKVGNGPHAKTGLELKLEGWDGEAIEQHGRLSLVAEDGTHVANWPIADLVSHWTKKHSKACYVHYEKRILDNGKNEYRYFPEIELYYGATFANFLDGFQNQLIYLDPGIKMQITPPFERKKRNQFRTRFKDLRHLYQTEETLSVLVRDRQSNSSRH